MSSKWNKVTSVQPNFEDTFNEDVELDIKYCRKILSRASAQNYAALNKWLKKCSSEWLEKFLECRSLEMMFSMLDFMGIKQNSSISDTVLQLSVIHSIKHILNSVIGIKYLLENQELVDSLTLSKYLLTFYILIFLFFLKYMFLK